MVRGRLRPPLAREDALLVAVDAQDPGAVAKSAKFQICSPTTASTRSKTRWDISSTSTWYSSVHGLGRTSCRPARVSAPYSVMMIGLSYLSAHARELGLQRALGGGEVAGVDVPAVVAVEHHDVEEVGDHVDVRRRAHARWRSRPGGSGRAAGPRRRAARSRRATRGVTDSGSLAMLHSTTHGWFLSRATSSRIACRWASCVAALIVSSENVVNGSAPKTPPARPLLMPDRRASRR